MGSIAIGQVAVAALSAQQAGRPGATLTASGNLRQRRPARASTDRHPTQKALAPMQLDKKVSGGEIKFVLAGASAKSSGTTRAAGKNLPRAGRVRPPPPALPF